MREEPSTTGSEAALAVEEPARVRPAPDATGGYQPVVYEPSPTWQKIYRRFFSHVQIEPTWASRVREAAKDGIVVYIGRAVSFLDFLALDFLTKEHGLPPIQFTNDLGMSIVEPFGRGSRRLRFSPQVPEERALAECLHGGHSALLFLRKKPPFASGVRRGIELDDDLVRALVELQRKIPRPIRLVPQTIVWTKRPPASRKTIVDLLFGPSEWPGRLRTFLQFALNYKNALLRAGEPFDLAEMLHESQDLTDAQAADRVRFALLRRMERERTVVLGPATKTSTRIRSEILRSPRIQQDLEQASRENGEPIAKVRAKAERELAQLCAAPDMATLDLFHRGLAPVWNRIYDGLVVDEEGLGRVREAARKGPLVFLPSHKSHVDYLIISDVLYANGLAPPLIAAGDNLSFFPLGPFLRRSGAFFIKRSFKGSKLYPKLVDAYVRKVLVEGHHLELFVEGGRSRTGKLLPPKLGILSMIVDAALKLDDREIQFVPVSIGYERIIEEGSYVRELEGGEKKAESVGGLFQSRRILRSKYGRLYLQFGEVLPFRALRGETRSPSPSERRALVQRIAHRVTYEINRVTIVTPAALAATALMSHRRRGIEGRELAARARELLALFQRHGARVARALADRRGDLRPEALEGALQLFQDGKLVTASAPDGKGERVYTVEPERRMALEYHKNVVLHFFVASALVATSLAALGWDTTLVALRDRVRVLSRLFKLEFMYRADADFEAIFSDALSKMIETGEVLWEGDRVLRATGEPAEHLVLYEGMLRTYVEAYRVALRAVVALGARSTTKKEWARSTLAAGARAYATGEVALRESIVRPKLENALAVFHELGIARIEGETVRAGAKIGDAAALEALLAEHLAPAER
ncbi:MAG: 1-acyl-sn-glycerol-3-phosphate acyltransferase [Sandaracinus sp.]